MRKSTLVVIVAIIFLIIIVIIGIFLSKDDQKQLLPDIPNLKDEPKDDNQESFYEQTDSYVIDIKYPNTSNNKIDEIVKDRIQPYIDNFKDYEESNRKYALIADYDVTSSDEYTTYVYTILNDTGGAHPNTNFETITFDIKGEEVGIEDILAEEFEDSVVTLDDLSELVKKKLYEKLGDEEGAQWIEEGASANLDNYRSFSVGESGLTLIFPPYQVGPYAWGVQNVTVTFDEIYKSTIENQDSVGTSTEEIAE